MKSTKTVIDFHYLSSNPFSLRQNPYRTMQLFFRELGEGQPLIVLHGLFGSSDNWVTVSKSLAERFHVYLVDQRNHGRSPHAPLHTYKSMAEDVLEFMEQHGIEQPIVLGHSMGGKTAMYLALHFPEVIKKLIVVDIAPRYYPPHHQDVIAGIRTIPLGTLTSREEADKLMSAEIKDLGVRQFLLKNLYRNDQGQFAWRMDFEGIVSQIENIGEESNGKPFVKPSLFIRGELSHYIQEKDIPLISHLFPAYKLITVEGAGHWVQAEKPKEFLEAVMS
jgi:pimeloyl-ACP methyl ester carboxylesterase